MPELDGRCQECQLPSAASRRFPKRHISPARLGRYLGYSLLAPPFSELPYVVKNVIAAYFVRQMFGCVSR